MRFLIRVLVTAVGLWVADLLVSGISVSGKAAWENVLTLLAVALIFGIVNAVLKPLIKLFGCFFYIITLGLIALVVNGLLFWLTGWLADKLNLPFHVSGFWAGFWGAIIVGVVSWLIGLIIPEPHRPESSQPRRE
jgi:putative membrane protein